MASKPDLTSAYYNENNSASLITVCGVFLALNILFVGLRFVSRYYLKSSFGFEDALLVCGLITCGGLCIDGIIAPSFGVGQRFAKVKATHPEKIPHWGWNGFYAIPVLYSFAVSFPKLSVLVLYLRIFVDRFSKYCCWTTFAVIAATCIVNAVTIGFQCGSTPKAAWHGEPGKCNNIQAHLTYGSLPNIVTDVIMLLLPIPVVRKLQVPKHVKVGIAMTFMLASIGLITAIIRFVQFTQNAYASDPTYKATPLIIWVVVESSIYLICACLLSCRPVLGKIIANNRVATLYSWLRRSTSRSPGQTSRSSGTNRSPEVLPTAYIRRGSSAEAFTGSGEGDYYKLEPAVGTKIHVKKDYNVESV